MVNWKESFERVSKELDLTKRKKYALEDLYNAGKISQYIYEYLDKEVAEDIAEIEARYKTLTERMTRKLNRLEEQLRALEIFLATSEMACAAEEVSQEVHAAESNALILGMEATKQELNMLREIIIQLVSKETATAAASTPTPTSAETVESTLTQPTIEKRTEVPSATGDAMVEQSIPVPVAPETTTTTTTETSSEGGDSPF
jgi:histone deacetylase complex regulatory component SIN3